MAWQYRSALLVALACVLAITSNSTRARGAAAGVAAKNTSSNLEPSIFAPGIISNDADEVGGSISPDGREFYFVVFSPYTVQPDIGLLCVSRLEAGRWTKPEALSFSGKYLNLAPRISPDGKRLYFASNRPNPSIAGRGVWIWYVERNTNGWSAPQALPAPINTEKARFNIDPSVASDGTLYFASNRDHSGIAIYRSKLVNGAYQEPERLGPEINFEGAYNWQPFIAPDQSYLLFGAETVDEYPFKKLPDELIAGGNPYARTDLYISENRNGNWSSARHLEHGINSAAEDSYPFTSADGSTLYFSSERSAFIVPLLKPVTYSQLEHDLGSISNGRGNVFSISALALDRQK